MSTRHPHPTTTSRRLHATAVAGAIAALSLVASGCGDDEPKLDRATIDRLCSAECRQLQSCEPEFFDYNSIGQCERECQDDSAPILLLAGSALESCLRAELALWECTANLSCADLDRYWESPSGDYPCRQEEDRTERACDFDF